MKKKQYVCDNTLFFDPMKTYFCAFVLVASIAFSACQSGEKESLKEVINRGLDVSTQQSVLMAKELENREGRFPKTIGKDGNLETSDYAWWCSGFFPGQLWYIYENTPTPEMKKYAEMYTTRVEPTKDLKDTHDLGFMIYCSFGNGLRITGKPEYKDVIVTGAHSLATRFNPTVQAIRSWDFNKDKWQFPVIIDNMMNLELFTWTARNTEDERFNDMANAHAKKTMKYHYRPDYSCYHVVSYDTITGLPHIRQTHQGYADESAWARGQSWGLYGYTMMYRETGDPAYLEQARHIASFLMKHPNMPEDKIPYWDFNAPDIPNAPRDASAAAVMASALIELSQLDSSEFGKECLDFAEEQVRMLTTPEYLAEPGTNKYFILKHSTGHLPGNSEVDVPLTYADYYFVEALMRLKDLLK